MRSVLSLALLAANVVTAAVVSPFDYSGYKVIRVPTQKDNVKEVQRIITDLNLDTWKYPKSEGQNADIVVPPSQITSFMERISGMSMEMMHEDLGMSISNETSFEAYSAGYAPDINWFKSYHSYQDHISYLQDLQGLFRTRSEYVDAGKSHEGRTIPALHIWGSGGKNSKPAIIFHGTIHAREWITTMVTEYLAWSLLSQYNKNADITSIVDNFDIWVFPIVNPDGFAFTQTSNRLWRKNRQPNPNARCPGRDLNRNYPYQWVGPGSSSNPCSDTYRGAQPGDGTEIKVHIANMKRIASYHGIAMFVDWHSYGQLFMSPYGYSCTARPPTDARHQELSRIFAQALRAVHGTPYRTGPICNTIYQVNGDSVDYALEVLKVKLSLTAELRDTGARGFVLPADQIVPSGEETLAGTVAMLKAVIRG
ncbi:zinc carboxypeptidase [Trichophyton tonsurans CBS 112818]|uniref:Metallocarboxypeptidase A n=2 Tax=Trichophyton tonsurans TaxID=34387 RepID=MCPA_TRITO|nr:RecName: Full=Metallocarboxypeptidase A; Short=MCPA; AltName: Full=Carboxypeptidase M14A; Flags: Precursor [Trichophyton tonsurans]EGD92691.1 zinc carboxypeptidase [Trichophyton tonsurans CBS 112818]ACJ06656.1 carboxypeptidase M14 [Trichophyton tonsurans]WGU19468.1 carboxypeptidase M14 [Trichophyton tonsurans]WGU19469.1 carboxypeptidase M14 [Trichophyton tonsurans]WGU19470.1 carboxypeptidase M14 [Trichophyton tonsurans]